MSTEITMSGFVSAECEARTLGDLRALVKWCDKYRVADEVNLDWGLGRLFVDLSGKEPASASWIECGDHYAGDEHWDLVVDTHAHPERVKDNGPQTFEEAREEALERDPAPFDWPARDRLNRYGDEARPE